jgi:hypothetical protein
MLSLPKQMYMCQLCDNAYRHDLSVDELRMHIGIEHIGKCVYECELCPELRFPTDGAVRNHCRTVHLLSDYYVSEGIDS